MISFEERSYKSQIHYLKQIAQEAIRHYNLTSPQITFINHGENTTFKLKTKNSDFFHLRINRNGYHTKQALTEEIRLLNKLSGSNIKCPTPVYSKDEKFITSVSHPDDSYYRNVTLFKWVPGRFIQKNFSQNHAYKLGKKISEMHNVTSKIKLKNRDYWSADGLIGKSPKWGSLQGLSGITKKTQQGIEQNRRLLLKLIKRFEMENLSTRGALHADIHFGNFLFDHGDPVFIDFDDCGMGFHMYDLAVLFYYLESIDEFSKKIGVENLKESLLEGYSENRLISSNDLQLIPLLTEARRLTLLGWLNSRSDHPILRTRLRKMAPKALKIQNKRLETLL